MRTLKHVRPVTRKPEQAQVSNFQIKLDFTTSVIDRLLLVDRQRHWKAVPGPGNGIDNDIGNDINLPF